MAIPIREQNNYVESLAEEFTESVQIFDFTVRISTTKFILPWVYGPHILASIAKEAAPIWGNLSLQEQIVHFGSAQSVGRSKGFSVGCPWVCLMGT